MARSSLFSFPNPVNEVSARLVAGGVVAMSMLVVFGGVTWLVGVMALGFIARVATGPTLSPLGQLVTRVLTPALPFEERLVPGPPKRFAQGIGATLSVAATVAHFGFGATTTATVLVAMIMVAASLEAFVGFCLGCWVFARLMDLGVIPADTCAECSDLSRRLGAGEPAQTPTV
jgi:hypothetical protein